jgi:calcineurin-like phosphoesterase family protein
MKYFTSDTHFGHHNVIGYCNRPFADVREMDAVMLGNMQRCLTDEDDLYFLGDWSMSHNYYGLIKNVPFRHLYFILGNHDKAGKLTKQLELDGIGGRVSVAKAMSVQIGDQDLYLVHRPMEASDEKPTLCGHVHEKWLRQEPGAVLREYKHHQQSEPRTIKQPILNVGVDQHLFSPLSEDQVLDLLS